MRGGGEGRGLWKCLSNANALMLIQWVNTHVGSGEGLEIDFFLRTYLMNAALDYKS
jgi:hypothetical protein